MKISQNGIDLIKRFEGCILEAYKDPVGIWTIGYGSTGHHAYGGAKITKAEAEDLLIEDLVRFEKGVLEACGTRKPTQNQFDAMVSLAFNIGNANFKKSTVARQFVAGNFLDAAEAFSLWVNARDRTTGKLVRLAGLEKRRAAEKNLFLSPDEELIRTDTRAKLDPKVERETRKGTINVPEASIIPEAPKPLTKSREIAGGIIISGGSLLETVTELRTSTEDLRANSNTKLMEKYHIPEIATTLVFLFGLFIIFKRISDRNKGIR